MWLRPTTPSWQRLKAQMCEPDRALELGLILRGSATEAFREANNGVRDLRTEHDRVVVVGTG
jgi:hypothetical protein